MSIPSEKIIKPKVPTFLNHLKTYIFRGLIAVIPIVISFFVVQFLYVMVDRRVARMIEGWIGFTIPGLGILLVLAILYLVGQVASNLAGKQLFGLIEKVSERIPLVRTTYQVGKQISQSLSHEDKQLFKRVVMVRYLNAGAWTIGFVTGTLIDEREPGVTLLKVFVPTPPNPTSGTMIIVRETDARDPGWTVEEGLKTVISGGIIGPAALK
jgi:uncharacterized membrane protein